MFHTTVASFPTKCSGTGKGNPKTKQMMPKLRGRIVFVCGKESLII